MNRVARDTLSLTALGGENAGPPQQEEKKETGAAAATPPPLFAGKVLFQPSYHLDLLSLKMYLYEL